MWVLEAIKEVGTFKFYPRLASTYICNAHGGGGSCIVKYHIS